MFKLVHSTSVSCPRVPTSLVLVNASETDITLQDLQTSPQEFVLADPTMQVRGVVLGPDEPIAIPLLYQGSDEGGTDGRLTVYTDRGCQSFEVEALATPSNVGTSDPMVLHYGNVRPGEVVTLEVALHQIGLSDSEYTSFQTVGGPFTIDNPPTEPFRYEKECDQLVLQVTLTAPDEPGPVEGRLQYEQSGSGLTGVIGIPLVGTVVR